MNHSFDVDVATKYGVNAAILLQNLYWWIQKNKANKCHYYDGTYWTYNTREAYTKLFPYLSERQVKTAMDKLIADGVVITGDYNVDRYKRPIWYAITEKGYTLLQNRSYVHAEMSERGSENVNSTNRDISTDNKTDISISRKRTDNGNPAGFDDFWDAYPRHKDKKSAIKAWSKLKPSDELKQVIIADVRRRVNSDREWADKNFIPYPATYLNGERWEDESSEIDTVETFERDLSVEEIMRRSDDCSVPEEFTPIGGW